MTQKKNPYSLLSDGQLRDAVADQLRQAEYAHFQATLVHEVAKARGDEHVEKQAQAQIDGHQAAIEHLSKRLEAFGDVPAEDNGSGG